MVDYLISVDIGATWTRLALSNDAGNILEKLKLRTPTKGRDLINSIINSIKSLLGADKKTKLKSIGIASIGPIDIREGKIVNTPNIPLGIVEVAGPIFDEFGIPVYFVNDCTAGVLGEYFFGAGKGFENVVYITLSSGIGGGAIVDGSLLFGKDGNAVEIGHFVVDPDGNLQCGCGGYGHWESYASGKNIPRFVRFLVESGSLDGFESSVIYKWVNGNLDELDAKQIFEAAKSGDEFSLKIVEKVGEINSIGFANVINAFDPDMITVGGGVALNNPDLILSYIKLNVSRFAINRVPEIRLTPLGEDIGLYGAIAIAKHPEYIPKEFRRFE